MSTLAIITRGSRKPDALLSHSSGFSPEAQNLRDVQRSLEDLEKRYAGTAESKSYLSVHERQSRTSVVRTSLRENRSAKSLDEQLYDALAACKVRISQVAMHLDSNWRI